MNRTFERRSRSLVACALLGGGLAVAHVAFAQPAPRIGPAPPIIRTPP